MKKVIDIVVLVIMTLLTFEVKADMEPVEKTERELTKIESFKEQVAAVKKAESAVKATETQAKGLLNQAKGQFDSAKSAIEDTVKKTMATVEAIKNGDIMGALQNVELSGIKGLFDGSKVTTEQEDAVLETMTREKGDNSIENQKKLAKVLNGKEGIEVANAFAKAFVTRQKLAQESDEIENPEDMLTAQKLAQEAQIASIKRYRENILLEATLQEYRMSTALSGMVRSSAEDEGGQDE